MVTKKPKYQNVRELLYWSYANLALAHSALSKGQERYGRVNYMIRAKLYKGLCQGTMSVGTILDEEKVKLNQPLLCCFCGSSANLTMDHLFSRSYGGPETADNVVWVCRSCNSSKKGADFLEWWARKHGDFPPLMLVRRYLKLAIVTIDRLGLNDCPIEDARGLPFDLAAVPTKYPQPPECRLAVV